MFRPIDEAARIFTTILLFLPPMWRVFMLEHLMIGIVRESVHGWITKEDRSTKIFGHVRVQTPTSWVAGESFFHRAMPLGQKNS